MSCEPSTSGSLRSKQSHAENFVCGAGAAFVETSLVFPIHKTSFRQQLHGISIKDALAQMRTEGWSKLYRGVLPPLLQKTTSRAIMFGMYDEFQVMFGCQKKGGFSLCHAKAAVLAGWAEAVLCPFERVQVLLQTNQYHSQLQNTQHAFVVLREYGIREYYRGLSPILIRNGVSNALFFAFRDPIRELILRESPENCSELQTFWADFISGAILGACLSTAFFPINVVKVRMQSKLGGPLDSFLPLLRLIWNERNRSLKDFYLGGRLNYTRSLLSWGITNSVYGVLKRDVFGHID